MKHTPEPWNAADLGDYVDFNGNSRVIFGGGHAIEDQRRVAVVQHDGSAEDEANTNRIVSCVNACAGIENPVRKALALLGKEKA